MTVVLCSPGSFATLCGGLSGSLPEHKVVRCPDVAVPSTPLGRRAKNDKLNSASDCHRNAAELRPRGAERRDLARLRARRVRKSKGAVMHGTFAGRKHL